MSNGQTLERQLITEFMREVLTYLRHRPGVALESLTHSTPEMSFDLGKVRKNQVIHNRAGDRIFITNLTGVAYIRFNSATASKYKLRVPGISTPFQKLYLENEAQPGKSVSIIIGYGGFVDFAATDFATQATLALIKTKIDTTLTEVQKLSTPVSIHDTSMGAALTVNLEVGHRRFIEVWVKSSAAAIFKIYDSRDNSNWRECDEIPLDGAGEIKNGYWNSSKYVMVSTAYTNNNEIEISAS